ncbi:MAG: hypothetical protein FWG64_09485 [Firmicutes bacterium]|nr:hypothetical protein [Bacillota bacterium]
MKFEPKYFFNIAKIWPFLTWLCLFIAIMLLGSGNFETSIIFFIAFIPIAIITLRVNSMYCSTSYTTMLSSAYAPVDILQTIEDICVQYGYSEAMGPGMINVRKRRFFGLVDYHVISIDLQEHYSGHFELIIYASHIATSAGGNGIRIPRWAGDILYIKSAILDGVAIYQ